MKSRVVHDRALLLCGCKRNRVLNLAEVEQYGLDSFLTQPTSASTECHRENGTVAASVYLVARLLSAHVTIWAII